MIFSVDLIFVEVNVFPGQQVDGHVVVPILLIVENTGVNHRTDAVQALAHGMLGDEEVNTSVLDTCHVGINCVVAQKCHMGMTGHLFLKEVGYRVDG